MKKQLKRYVFNNLPNGRGAEIGYGTTPAEARQDALDKIALRKPVVEITEKKKK